MPIFLGFFINTKTKQEFVAPTEAETRSGAEHNLTLQYPSPLYTLLTTYERKEMDSILANLDRWPGLPSKVQPSMEQLLQNVSVSKTLPPLHHPKTQAPTAFDGARIEQVRQAVRDTAPEVQALAARLMAATVAPQPTPPFADTAYRTAAPAAKAPASSILPAISSAYPKTAAAPANRFGGYAEPAPQLPSAPAMAAPGQGKATVTARPSLIDVLKTLR